MSRALLFRQLLLLAGGLLFVLVALVGWQSYQVASSLTRVAQDADAAQGAVESGEGIAAVTVALQSSAAEAADEVNDWRWSLVTRLPWVGDDADGVRVVANIASDLSAELEPAATASADLTRLLPDEGRIDVAAVRDLQAPFGAAAEAFAAADDDLDDVDPSGFVGALRGRFDDLRSQVGDAADGLDAASVAVELLPGMLGADGPRNYLLVFQNNAEIRATGGLPGSLSVISTDDGAIDLVRQVSAGSLGERDRPVLPLSEDERAIFTEYLGVFAADANFTPDWPRASDLLRARFEEIFPERLDGTLTLDTVAVSYLLGATGPMTIDGYTLTSENAVDVLLNQVYLDVADGEEQNALFQKVASTMFERISGGDIGRPRELLKALVRATHEGRTAVHLYNAGQQELIDGRAVTGQEVNADGRSEAITVAMNDGTAAKMSYYLDYNVRGRATTCVNGREHMTVQATLHSDAPRDAATTLSEYVVGFGGNGLPPGSQIVETRLFTPSDGVVTNLRINGKEFDVKDRQLVDRFVSTVYVYLEPGQTVDVEWILSAPASTDAVSLNVTPGIAPGNESSQIASAC